MSEKHIIEEGSRAHVVWWDAKGRHCGEPGCEINAPGYISSYKPKKFRMFDGTRKPSMKAVRQYVSDVRSANRIILTAEDIFAATELLPLLLDRYDDRGRRLTSPSAVVANEGDE